MQAHVWTAIVTLLALLVYFYMGARVGRDRARYGIEAPAVTGDPNFERSYRIQMNTLEWLPIFLPSLWLFAVTWNADIAAALIGVVWILGRILYLINYARDPKSRGAGFGIQSLATGVLLFGALGRLAWMAVARGA